MEFLFWYLVGIVTMFAVSAWRVNTNEVRAVFYMSLLWPVSLTMIAIIIIAELIPYKPTWSFNVSKNQLFFGFRGTDDGQPGFAITVFKLEFQFWKTRS